MFHAGSISISLEYTAGHTIYSRLWISIGFILVCRGLSGLVWLSGRLDGLLLAAFFGAAVGGPVQDALRGVQCLEVLPGAQQGRVVDQRVQQLPARSNPLPAGPLVGPIVLNP